MNFALNNKEAKVSKTKGKVPKLKKSLGKKVTTKVKKKKGRGKNHQKVNFSWVKKDSCGVKK